MTTVVSEVPTDLLSKYALAGCYALLVLNGRMCDTQNLALAGLELVQHETGIAITLAPQAVIDKPIQFIFMSSTEVGPTQPFTHRIQLASQSQMDIVITHAAPDTEQHDHHQFEIDVAACARLGWYTLTEAAPTRHAQEQHTVTLGKDAFLQCFSFALGSAAQLQQFDITLSGTGAQCDLSGVFALSDTHQFNQHLTITHAASHTRSEQRYRGLVNDKAKGLFHGMVKASEGVDHIVAHQENKNLLLAPGASMQTQPQLEIYTDDVQCSHGATIGQLDEAALFYLTSRGLDAGFAKTLLMYSFVQTHLEAVPHAAIRSACDQAFLAQLPGGDAIKEWFSGA